MTSKARGLANLGNAYSDGALSNRNVILNGNLTVNQRSLSIASVATGAYGEDRWKKTAGGMTQIIEELNYLPSTEYTLSGTGITTQQITSPASGNWTLPDIPVTARLIQLEVGDTATPFEHRSYGDELARCHRFYYRRTYESSAYQFVNNGRVSGQYGTTNGSIVETFFQFPVTMRSSSTVSYSSANAFRINNDFADETASGIGLGSSSPDSQVVLFTKSSTNLNGGSMVYVNRENLAASCWIAFDAEL